MTVSEYLDMEGNALAEGDYVVFADQMKSLRIAKIRAIKQMPDHASLALEIVSGVDVKKRRYSRDYIKHDFLKIDGTKYER